MHSLCALITSRICILPSFTLCTGGALCIRLCTFRVGFYWGSECDRGRRRKKIEKERGSRVCSLVQEKVCTNAGGYTVHRRCAELRNKTTK